MIYQFGDCELDESRREVSRSGHRVAIEPKMFDVLLYLLNHRDRVVTKEELLDACWPETCVSESALTRCLAKIRKAMHAKRDEVPVIKTIHGQGYRFVAEVVVPAQVTSPHPAGHTHNEAFNTDTQSIILIVDDDPFNVDYLEQELEDQGYKTLSATNGQEALEKVATQSIDLILLDVIMPVMDGFTVCRLLKEDEQTRLLPIIIMTALGATEDRIKGIKAGADDFLTKPVNEEELLARIQTALKLKHTVDRKIGELHQLKSHFTKFVRLVTLPDDSVPST